MKSSFMITIYSAAWGVGAGWLMYSNAPVPSVPISAVVAVIAAACVHSGMQRSAARDAIIDRSRKKRWFE